MITLYDYELSGNCYKVRLLLSFLALEYKPKTIEFYPAEEHLSSEFLAINPLGELPVLQDDDLTICDSQAILCYLSSRYDATGLWFPSSDPKHLAEVMQWLCFANGLTSTVSAARLVEGFFHKFDVEACRTGAHRHFRILDEHLWFNEREGREWLAQGRHPTVADIACFAYTVLSEEGNISRMDYPSIRRWTDRVKRIPKFIVMPGVFPAGPAL